MYSPKVQSLDICGVRFGCCNGQSLLATIATLPGTALQQIQLTSPSIPVKMLHTFLHKQADKSTPKLANFSHFYIKSYPKNTSFRFTTNVPKTTFFVRSFFKMVPSPPRAICNQHFLVQHSSDDKNPRRGNGFR